MSERVIPSDAVLCIDRFSGALVRKYQARMIPGQPVFLDRGKAMEATRAYFNSKEGGGEGDSTVRESSCSDLGGQ